LDRAVELTKLNPMRRSLKRLLCATLMLTGPAVFSAIELPAGNEPVEIKKTDLLQLIDRTGSLSFTQIENTGEFKPVDTGQKQWFNELAPAYWLKAEVLNKNPEKLYLGEEFTTSLWRKIDLYVRCNGRLHHGTTGTVVAVSKRDIPGGDHILELPECNNQPYLLYIRLERNVDPIYNVRLTIQTLPSMSNRLQKNMILHAIFFGIVIIMSLYNFLIFVYSRDRAFLYYTISSVINGLLWSNITGFSAQFLWPEHPLLSNWIGNYGAFFSLFSAILFFRTFMKLKEKMPRSNTFFHIIQWVVLVLALFPRIISWETVSELISVTTIIFTVTMVPTTIKLILDGNRHALFFLAGWAGLIISLIIYPLGLLGVIPFSYYAYYSIEFGSVYETILFSLGLGYRYNELERQKEALLIQTRNIDAELEMAKRIQETLLPVNDSPHISTIYQPMTKIGGDFYDIIDLPESKTGFLVSDVCGHGIPAALVTTMIKGVLSEEIKAIAAGKGNPTLENPKELLLKLNKEIRPKLHNEYITATYGVINFQKKTINIAGSSHPPPIVLYTGKQGERVLGFLKLNPQMFPIGVFDNDYVKHHPFKSLKFSLPSKSLLIFYSDGFMDLLGYNYREMDKGLSSFNGTPLYSIFAEAPLDNPSVTEKRLSELIATQKGNSDEEDDICIVIVSV